MDILHGDFETRSPVELGGDDSVGLYNYATHPRTQLAIFAYALNDQRVAKWEILQGEPMPLVIKQAALDPEVHFAAWNSAFERYMFLYKLGLDIPYKRWEDPQASARYLSLPDDLETAALVLGLPIEMQKFADGKRLIKLFSKMVPERTRRGKKGQPPIVTPAYFRDWISDPLEWYKFGEYCEQDVVTEREVMRRLAAFKVYPLPEREHQIWLLDQKINDRGMPTNRLFVQKSLRMGLRAKQDAIDKQKAATGLENPNSRNQMLAWVRERGYPKNSLRKEVVKIAVEDETNALTPEARAVLKYRKVSSSTSYKKLETIERLLCADDRARNQFIFMGSSRAGRWSSGGIQLHNMARPEDMFEEEDDLNDVRNLIWAEDYEGIIKRFTTVKDGVTTPGEPLLAVKSSLRSAFEAPKGKRLNVSDLNAIETRVAAWLAGCQPLLDVFVRPNGDPYIEFASKMTGILYEDLDRDYHGKDKKLKAVAKRHRQIAKPGVLGCVYRLGPGGWGINRKNGDPMKIGLWGYAENMGVKMTLEEAQNVVHVFRESYPEIQQLWFAFEKAVFHVLAEGSAKDAVAYLGPNDCIRIDKLNRKDKLPVLRIKLPSGRFLHYLDAHIEESLMPWKRKVINPDTGKTEEKDEYRPNLVYSGINQDTKQWETNVRSHGGKLTENVVQAISRDILAEGMLLADAEGFEIDGHVHDEIITESFDDPFDLDYTDLEKIMSRPIVWLPDLPLGAAGYSGSYYHK